MIMKNVSFCHILRSIESTFFVLILFFFIFEGSYSKTDKLYRNRIITLGRNSNFQLATYLPTPLTVSKRTLIQNFPGEREFEVQYTCTSYDVTYFLLTNGSLQSVYGVGSRYYANEEEDLTIDQHIPLLCNFPNSERKIEKIYCAKYHTVFKASNSTFYGIGSNMRCVFAGCDAPPSQVKTFLNIKTGILEGLRDEEVMVFDTASSNTGMYIRNGTEMGIYMCGYGGYGLMGEENHADTGFGWLRINDTLILNEAQKGNELKQIVYIGQRGIYFLMMNNDMYFAGENFLSLCNSVLSGSGITYEPIYLPIHEGGCYRDAYPNELEGKEIDEIKCNFENCFAITNSSEIISWGEAGVNEYRMGHEPVTGTALAVNLSHVPQDLVFDSFIHHMYMKYIVYKDVLENRKRIFGFGKDHYYGYVVNFDEELEIGIPVEILEDFKIEYDAIFSEGKMGPTLFIHLSTTCYGYYANDSVNVCSGRGDCIDTDNCLCLVAGYYGEYCNYTICYNVFSNVEVVCNSHGTCIDNDDCSCYEDYQILEDCSVWECFGVRNDEYDTVCSDNGDCVSPDVCECYFVQRGVNSSTCEIPMCFGIFADEELVCSSSGFCVSNDTCECIQDYDGENCSEYTIESNLLEIILYSAGGAVGASILLCLCFIVCCFCCCCCFAIVTFRIVQTSRKKLSKFKELEDFDLILEEQKLEKDSSIAHLKINKELFVVDKSEIKLKKILGEGGSDSVVYLAEWKGRNVGFKCFKTRSICRSQNNFDEFEREVAILGSVNHPHIIQYYGSCLSPPRIGFIMEYCSNGDLNEYLLRKKERRELFEFSEKIRILTEISSALLFLHSKKIIHRDLKLENVLLTSSLVSKLMDFGLSKFLEKTQQQKTKGIGTSYYMSPEIVLGKDYNEKTDVFSFGVLIYVLISEKRNPYEGKSYGIELRVANNPSFRPKFDEETDKFPKFLVKLTKNCWNHNPEERKSFEEIIEVLKSAKLDSDSSESGKLKNKNEKGEEIGNENKLRKKLFESVKEKNDVFRETVLKKAEKNRRYEKNELVELIKSCYAPSKTN